MKKLLILSALGLLTIGLLSQPSSPINEGKQLLDIDEFACDFVSEEGIKLSNKKVSIGLDSELDVSKTFVQFGTTAYEGHDVYVVRYATAVKGDVSSITYERAGFDDVEAKLVSVETLYKGISVGEETYYYDGNGGVSTEETYAGNYYWACYTIRYKTSSLFDQDMTLKLSVNGEEKNEITKSFTTVYSESATNAGLEIGSEAYPYLLATDEDLEAVIADSHSGSTYLKNYKLVNDLYTTSQISSSSYNFSGSFDGNGYAITVNQNFDGVSAGLFFRISVYGKVENLTVKGSIKATNAAEFNGGITPVNYGLIRNCVNEATIELDNNDVNKYLDSAGIAGFVEGAGVHNCVNKGNITGSSKRVGGIVGRLSSSVVKNCVNYGQITAAAFSSGIVGVEWDTSIGTVDKPSGITSVIEKCYNYGEIISNGLGAAGIVSYTRETSTLKGAIKCEVKDCINEANITGAGHIGGIVGYGHNYNLYVANSINKGSITGTGDNIGHIGGIVGMLGNYNSIENSYNYGKVSGSIKNNAGLGGIAGSVYTHSVINNCHTILVDGVAEDVLICKDTLVNKGQYVGFYNDGLTTTQFINCGLIKE